MSAEHPYFEKRIRWEIVRFDKVNFYTEQELSEIESQPFQSVFINVEEFGSVGNYQMIAQILNMQQCFEFSYSPSLNDICSFFEIFRYNGVKHINRQERMFPRMTFLYTAAGWELFSNDFRRGKSFKSGIVSLQKLHPT